VFSVRETLHLLEVIPSLLLLHYRVLADSRVLGDGLTDGQEDLELLHTWQGSDGSLQHGLRPDLNVLVHGELQVGGEVDVVQHWVPGVSSGGTFARERRGVVVLVVGGVPER